MRRGTCDDLVRARVASNAEPLAATGAVEPELVVGTRRIFALIDERRPRFFRSVRRGTLQCRVAAVAEFRLRARAAPWTRDQQHGARSPNAPTASAPRPFRRSSRLARSGRAKRLH